MLLRNAISTNLRRLIFKIFWGSMPLDPLAGQKFRSEILYSTWNPLKIWPGSTPENRREMLAEKTQVITTVFQIQYTNNYHLYIWGEGSRRNRGVFGVTNKM